MLIRVWCSGGNRERETERERERERKGEREKGREKEREYGSTGMRSQKEKKHK